MTAKAVSSATNFATLDEVSAFITKGSTPTTYGFRWEKSGVLFLRSECVGERGFDLGQSMFISAEANKALRRSQVTDGDILLTITGNVGRVIRLAGTGEANINQHIARIRVKDERFDRGYVYHFLSQRSMRDYYESIVTGQAYPQISLAQVRDTKIPVLSIGEQRAISAALDDVDESISGLERLIAKRQAIRQGLMQQLLAGTSRLPGFSGRWSNRKISDFARVRAGGTPSTTVKRYWGGNVPWMNSGEVHQKQVLTVRGRITEHGLRESSAHLFPSGTVLVALAGQGKTRGTVGISRIPLATNQSIAGIYPSSEHDADYLYFNLDSRYLELRGESAGEGGRGGLNLKILNSLEVPYPGIQEQRAIARVLMDGYLEISCLSRKLRKAQDVKRGMMQELLTGRTRWPVQDMAA